MSFKIIVDSCCDLPKDKRVNSNFVIVPLTIQVDDYNIIDDDTFNQEDLIRRMKASPNAPKSSCPSPESYMKAFDTAKGDIYVVTLSSKLSGSYNSAELAKRLYLEEHPEKNIEVIDSLSASVGEVLIALKIEELILEGKTFDQIVNLIYNFRDTSKIYFVLGTLDNLRKNGRLSNVQAVMANVLNIKPVMTAVNGEIFKLDQARGTNKALMKMIELIKSDTIDYKNRILAISHCNCMERALMVKDEIVKRYSFKNVLIVEQAGISTLYTNDGGILISY